MKLTQIRHCVAVAEHGNLHASAQDLGVSRKTLLRSIQELERELGSALFKRGDKAMTLTPVGKIFVRRAALAQGELDQARQALQESSDQSAERVVIGICASAQVALLPKVLMPFQNEFPNARIRTVEGAFATLVRDLREGALDFYMGPVGPHDRADGLKFERLYDVAHVVVGRKGHPLAGATSLGELAGAQWIAPSAQALDPMFEHRNLPKPVVSIEIETGPGMFAAAAANDALIIVSESWSPTIEQMGVLAAFPLIGALDSTPIFSAVRTELALSAAAACLHTLILSAATPHPT